MSERHQQGQTNKVERERDRPIEESDIETRATKSREKEKGGK